jgi:exodeoxyribonuclease VII small subunit
MKRLAQIVERLESGELTLEQSLVLFEEGVTLSRMAQTKLEEAQKKVEQLISVDGQGRTKTTPFEP